MRAANGGKNTYHRRDRMADVNTSIDMEGVDYVHQVVHITVKGGVSAEVEVTWVYCPGTDEIVQHYAVVRHEEREHPLPGGLVCPEAVSKDKVKVSLADDPDIQRVEEIVGHVLTVEQLLFRKSQGHYLLCLLYLLEVRKAKQQNIIR